MFQLPRLPISTLAAVADAVIYLDCCRSHQPVVPLLVLDWVPCPGNGTNSPNTRYYPGSAAPIAAIILLPSTILAPAIANTPTDNTN